VSYAPKKRGVEGLDADISAVASAKASAAADADVEAAVGAAAGAAGSLDDRDGLTIASARVVRHLAVRRGVDPQDGRDVAALKQLAGGAPLAPVAAPGGPGAHFSGGIGGGMGGAGDNLLDLDMDEDDDHHAVKPTGGYKDIPRGYYKDNYLNRRLGRVGECCWRDKGLRVRGRNLWLIGWLAGGGGGCLTSTLFSL
jgi:hypothetical protein